MIQTILVSVAASLLLAPAANAVAAPGASPGQFTTSTSASATTDAALPPVQLAQNDAPDAARGGAPGTDSATAGRGRGRGAPVVRVPPPPRPGPLPPFYDPKLPVQKRVDDLVSRLNLEEKVSLMQMASPSIPRLGIAPYHWWTEALHGMTHDTATVFPQAIGLAATWDTNLHFEGRHGHQHRRPRQEP